jgi:hypothetical protein
MLRAILRGAAAGAAGTTALNAVTYLDMAWRGRPASSTPERTVETLADRAGQRIPGEGGTRDSRLTALGSLTGIATGVGIGVAGALLRAAGLRLPLAVGGPLLGAAAMAGTDLPMAALDVTDVREWSRDAWLADAVPHLVYGVVTAAVVHALDRG